MPERIIGRVRQDRPSMLFRAMLVELPKRELKQR